MQKKSILGFIVTITKRLTFVSNTVKKLEGDKKIS